MLDRVNDYGLLFLFLQSRNMQELAYSFGISERALYNRFAQMRGVDRAFQGMHRTERKIIYELMMGETSARTIMERYRIRVDNFTRTIKRLTPGASSTLPLTGTLLERL
jgi:hypothetical protein